MIAQNVADEGGIPVRGRLRDQILVKTALDENLSGAAVQRVDALDQPGFDHPLPLQPAVEVLDASMGRKLFAVLVPILDKMREVGVYQFLPTFRQVLDGTPSIANGVLGGFPSHGVPRNSP